MTASRTVRIKRMDGTVVDVLVADALHYEVTIEGADDGNLSGDDYYQRYELVIAETAAAAKRGARGTVIAEQAEHVLTARRLTPAEVAVYLLHDAIAVREQVTA